MLLVPGAGRDIFFSNYDRMWELGFSNKSQPVGHTPAAAGTLLTSDNVKLAGFVRTTRRSRSFRFGFTTETGPDSLLTNVAQLDGNEVFIDRRQLTIATVRLDPNNEADVIADTRFEDVPIGEGPEEALRTLLRTIGALSVAAGLPELPLY